MTEPHSTEPHSTAFDALMAEHAPARVFALDQIHWKGEYLMDGADVLGLRHPSQRSVALRPGGDPVTQALLTAAAYLGAGAELRSDQPAQYAGQHAAPDEARRAIALLERELPGTWIVASVNPRLERSSSPALKGEFWGQYYSTPAVRETASALSELSQWHHALSRQVAHFTAFRAWCQAHGLPAPGHLATPGAQSRWSWPVLMRPEDADALWAERARHWVALQLGALLWLSGQPGSPFEQVLARTWSRSEISIWQAAAGRQELDLAFEQLMDWSAREHPIDLDAEISALQAGPGYWPSAHAAALTGELGDIERSGPLGPKGDETRPQQQAWQEVQMLAQGLSAARGAAGAREVRAQLEVARTLALYPATSLDRAEQEPGWPAQVIGWSGDLQALSVNEDELHWPLTIGGAELLAPPEGGHDPQVLAAAPSAPLSEALIRRVEKLTSQAITARQTSDLAFELTRGAVQSVGHRPISTQAQIQLVLSSAALQGEKSLDMTLQLLELAPGLLHIQRPWTASLSHSPRPQWLSELLDQPTQPDT